jgi:hypothetical protein
LDVRCQFRFPSGFKEEQMQIFSGAIFIIAMGFVSIGLLLGQESSPTDQSTSDPSISYQSLITFDAGATIPFAVNPTVAKHLSAEDEKIARKEFESIKAKLATLVRQYPHTKAGKDAAEMIDRAGLCAGPSEHNSLYPKGTFFSIIPITR